MYSASIFNYYTVFRGKTVVFNSLTEILACIHECISPNAEGLNKYYNSTNEKIKQQLIEYGLVAKISDNENEIAKIKFFDRIANKDLYYMILPTYDCNFRCKYCYEDCKSESKSFQKISMSEDMQKSITRHIRSTLGDYRCLIVEWHGGEPLLQLDIINKLSLEFIDIAARLGKPFISTVTTNGFYLTEDVTKQMLKNHAVKFHVTIDGFDWNHDYYRPDANGHPTFNTVMNNLISIKNGIKQKNFHVVLRTNITKRFLPFLDEWLKYISEHFSDDNRFQVYIKIVEDKGGDAINGIANDLLESEKELYDIIARSPHKNNYVNYYQNICSSICSAAMRNKHIISPDGIIEKCGHQLFNPITDVGIINEIGQIKYDRNSFSRWINVNKERRGKCKDCVLWASCYNSFCPLKTNFPKPQNDIAVCSGEHYNIEEVLTILLNPSNTSQNMIRHIG